MKDKKFYQDEYLRRIIPSLNQFSFLSGTEGRVYFVDDDFVVKTYFQPIDSLEIFENYFKEIQSFAEKGYSVPKIYSWAFTPCENGKEFCAYTLQERVKGKNLFDLDLESFYESCNGICTKEEFDRAVGDRKSNPELLGLLIREYIASCLRTNQALLDLSETELEKFLSTDFNIGVESRYSISDVQAANVLFDGQNLRIIDNGFLGYDKGLDSESVVKANLMRDAFLLFYNNESVKWLPKFRCLYSDEINKLKDQNMDASFLAMRRFVRKVNQMYSPVLSNIYDYKACESIAEEVFNENLAKQICSEVQRDF